METIYIKVPVEKWMENTHPNDVAYVVFDRGKEPFAAFYIKDGFYGCSNIKLLHNITHVLVEKAIPTDEEANKAAYDFGNRVDPDNITLEKQADCVFGHKTGFKWLRDKILGI